MKKLTGFLALMTALVLLLMALPGLGGTRAEETAQAASADLSEYFTERDLSGEWDEAEAVQIALEGDGAA